MKRKFFSLFIGMAMIITGTALSSCSNNDDDEKKPSEWATTAPLIYCSESMMEYFDVTCTIDGKTVTLTNDNTEAVEQTLHDSNGDPMYFKLRCYVGDKKEHTSFPATSTVVETVKEKSGVDISKIDKLHQFVMYIKFDTTNANNDEWETLTGSLKSVFQEGVLFSQMDAEALAKYKNVNLTTSIAMSNYKNAVVTSAFSEASK